MRPPTRQILAFGSACLLTVAAWRFCWPHADAKAETSPAPLPLSHPEAVDFRKLLQEALAEIDRAKSNQDRLAAMARLGDIPVADIPAALESIELVKDRSLTLAAKTLLIRWAAADGEAAVNWAWPRLRAGGPWGQALGEITASWAWHDSAGLAKWTKAMMGESGAESFEEPSLEEVVKRDKPWISHHNLSTICRFLMRESPGLAFEIILKGPEVSVDEKFMDDSFQSPEQIREALLAFRDLERLDLDPMTATEGPGVHAIGLLQRWNELDAAGLAASPYGRFFKPSVFGEGAAQLTRFKALPTGELSAAADRFLDSLPAEHQRGYVYGIVGAWASRDPEACREWLDALPPELARSGTRPFAAGAGASHLEAIWTESEAFVVQLREGCRIDSHAAWRKAHPEGQPDMSAWSESAKQTWNDLDTLWQIRKR